DRSLLDVQLLTGRKHQIRQHLSGIGFPIVGDRLYGNGEADGVDLQLQSVNLSFRCPISGSDKSYRVPDSKLLRLSEISSDV
ncbi:MAG: RNA pseudouridine synthase, partial [Pseudomonadota bacterium]|nr:RNA pseudouridine synthase [Pseudomonadota bacterium]